MFVPIGYYCASCKHKWKINRIFKIKKITASDIRYNINFWCVIIMIPIK